MKLHKMSVNELENYRQYCVQTGNTKALAEYNDFIRFYGKVIKVIKCTKLQKGIIGTVFYVERIHYGRAEWTGWSTRIGFKTSDGQVFFTNKDNIKLV